MKKSLLTAMICLFIPLMSSEDKACVAVIPKREAEKKATCRMQMYYHNSDNKNEDKLDDGVDPDGYPLTDYERDRLLHKVLSDYMPDVRNTRLDRKKCSKNIEPKSKAVLGVVSKQSSGVTKAKDKTKGKQETSGVPSFSVSPTTKQTVRANLINREIENIKKIQELPGWDLPTLPEASIVDHVKTTNSHAYYLYCLPYAIEEYKKTLELLPVSTIVKGKIQALKDMNENSRKVARLLCNENPHQCKQQNIGFFREITSFRSLVDAKVAELSKK